MGRNILGLDLTISQPWPSDADWISTYTSVWYGAATLMVAQRLLPRLFRYGSTLGLDDVLILGGWLGSTAFLVEVLLMLASINDDTSKPLVPPSKFEFIASSLWGIELSFLISQCLVKLAVLAILRRFVKDTADTRIRYAIWGAATLTATYSLAIILALFILCQPFQAYWRAFNPEYESTQKFHCHDQTVSNILAGVIAVLSDLYTIAIPWAISRSFGLTKRQTLALNTVFTFGLIVTAASCLRTYYFYFVLRGIEVPKNLVNLAIWGAVEIFLAIICACMPSLRVIYRLIVRSRLSNAARQRIYIRREELETSQVEDQMPRDDIDMTSYHSTSSLSARGNDAVDSAFSQSSIESGSAHRKPSPEITEQAVK